MYAVYARGGGGSILDWFSKVGDCRRRRRMLVSLWPCGKRYSGGGGGEEEVCNPREGGRRAGTGEREREDGWIGELFVSSLEPRRLAASTRMPRLPLLQSRAPERKLVSSPLIYCHP